MILQSKNGNKRVYKIGQDATLTVRMKGNQVMVETSLHTDKQYNKTLEELHKEELDKLDQMPENKNIFDDMFKDKWGQKIEDQLNDFIKNRINPNK